MIKKKIMEKDTMVEKKTAVKDCVGVEGPGRDGRSVSHLFIGTHSRKDCYALEMEEEKKIGKIVYFVTSMPSCKVDVDRLIPAFQNLGYETITFENPTSVQQLQDDLDKLDNRATIKEAIIILHGYGFPGSGILYDYTYIGNEVLSHQRLVQMFHPDIHIALFSNDWFKVYNEEEHGPIMPTKYHSFRSCDHLQIQINGSSEDGSLLARSMLQVLDDFAISDADEIQFRDLVGKVVIPKKTLKKVINM